MTCRIKFLKIKTNKQELFFKKMTACVKETKKFVDNYGISIT
ncbi:MAG: hypothetical protein SOZ22_05100 [Ezakiella sp.]|nr:hypothetical protein [Bacillota bacterium]MDY3923679.1 hypothetical protein [Ezakiella sp.]